MLPIRSMHVSWCVLRFSSHPTHIHPLTWRDALYTILYSIIIYNISASLSPELIIISFMFAFMGVLLHYIIYFGVFYFIYCGANFSHWFSSWICTACASTVHYHRNSNIKCWSMSFKLTHHLNNYSIVAYFDCFFFFIC